MEAALTETGPRAFSALDVIVNPRVGGGGGDMSQFEKQMIEKDFKDKAHSL